MKVLLTGISGFVGHHIFQHIMKNTDWTVLGMHRNSMAGDIERLHEIMYQFSGADEKILMSDWQKRSHFLHYDLRDPMSVRFKQIWLEDIDLVLHVAANSHVDRSIADPKRFLRDNVEGTLNLMEAFRGNKRLQKFIYFSTDEVYGNAPNNIDPDESFPHRPRNPYAASKAAAEDFANAYRVTYGLPIIITNTMNIVGERQNPEKYVPLIINKLLSGEVLEIHAYPNKERAGSRHYLHARNAAAALLFVAEHGKIGERYNIVGEVEIDNDYLARTVASYVNTWRKEHNLPELELKYELVDFAVSRPGHDLRYALSGTKLKELGYEHPIGFWESLRKTVYWTLEHADRWL